MSSYASKKPAWTGHVVRVLVLFLPIALLICIGIHYLYQKELRLLLDQREEHEQKDIAVGVAAIQRTLQAVSRDLIYLSDRPAVQEMLDGRDAAKSDTVTMDWLAFSQAKQVYDKIRWIDENGIERVRVDYGRQEVSAVPRSELRDKSDRYFFSETLKLGRNEVFISPLDLNMEDGRIEIPYRPTVRIGMPVFDSAGNKRGINLINYSAGHMFGRIEQPSRKASHPVWLVDQDGYWLKGPTPEDEFGFMFGRQDRTMTYRHPEAWKRILEISEGQFETEAGLWSFRTVYPLLDEAQAQGKYAFKIRNDAGGRQYLWKAISFLPAEQYRAGAAMLKLKLGSVALVLLALFLAGSNRIVRARQRERDLVADLTRKGQRLRTLLDTIPEMIWLKEGKGVYVSCNPAFERFFGWREGSSIGKTDFDLHSPENAETFIATDRVVIETGTLQRTEDWVATTASGQHALLQKTKVPVRTADGELIGILGIGHDITERKRIESELRASHDLLVNLTAQVPDIIYQFRLLPDGRMCMPYVSEAAGIRYGMLPDQVRDDASALLGLCHPDDIPALMNSILESAHTMQPWSCEFRVSMPDAATRWHRGDAKPQRLEDGSTLWHGYISDITDRRLAEEEQRLAATVYRHSGEGMMITDSDNLIIAVNPAFEEITGYRADEVIGKNPRILGSGRHGKVFYQTLVQELDATGRWQGDLWKRRKNGDIYITRCRVNAIFNENGSLQRRVALFSDITEKKHSEELIWQHANFDQLTGLPNRRMFLERLKQEIRKTHRSGDSIALLFIDLDHFKDINDTFGHDSGDLLLKEAAQRLMSCVRETDTAARLGGDEFTLLLGQLGESMNVERVVNSILRKLSEPFRLEDEYVYVSASIGVTFYPQDADNKNDLLKNADQAMYAAKQQGRNRYQYFTASMQEASQARMRLINDLRLAVAGNQFRVMYQPIVELAGGSVYKAEALIRWQHPERGQVSPAEFIGTAEDTGMILIIGDWIFRTAAMQAARWRSQHEPRFQVSVNISPVQFGSDGMDMSAWFEYLRQTGLPAEGIVVEITESLLLDASDSVTDKLLAFRNAGVEVALDDFGTGYSSLSYLKKFDIDYLKIDQAFVRNLGVGSDDMALCEAIIMMAHKLGLKVIAEGVETKEQFDILVAAGCDFAQGYYFSPPVTEAELERMLENRPASTRKLAAR